METTMKIFDFLPGMKTYIVGVGMIMTGLGTGLTSGDLSLIDWNLVLEALAIMGLRKGMENA
jgi:hypothetical protein